MIFFPNSKINLGLQVLRKRPDGFHDIETVFYPIGLKDALEVIEDDGRINSIEVTGLPLPIMGEDNICLKAYYLLKKDYPLLPAVKMHLHKTIPSEGGLGGGSADGAFTLQLLNQKFRIGLSENQLLAYAAALGSDCPFFIKNKPCLAKGRGEILEEVELDLSPYRVIIVNPRIHVSTALAFKEIEPDNSRETIMNVILRPVSEWREYLNNDFEKLIFRKYPEIAHVKKELYNAGAMYTSMSGSGSSLYGIFIKDAQPVLNFPDHYFVRRL